MSKPGTDTNVELLDDIFEVLEVDPDGKKFDKVSRVTAHSQLYDMDLVLDVNVDLYPLQAGDKVALCLSPTLNLDGSGMPVGDPGQQVYDTSVGKRATLADGYEYVMFGKVFKYKDATQQGKVKAEVYASFGGLLMQLSGDPKKLEDLDVDNTLYLLMRKV
jgi:DNA-directed RNA polymerase I, II, and III subunit RPABC3